MPKIANFSYLQSVMVDLLQICEKSGVRVAHSPIPLSGLLTQLVACSLCNNFFAPAFVTLCLSLSCVSEITWKRQIVQRSTTKTREFYGSKSTGQYCYKEVFDARETRVTLRHCQKWPHTPTKSTHVVEVAIKLGCTFVGCMVAWSSWPPASPGAVQSTKSSRRSTAAMTEFLSS